jgi:hypothetical protein
MPASAKDTDNVQVSVHFKPYETRLLVVGDRYEIHTDEQ